MHLIASQPWNWQNNLHDFPACRWLNHQADYIACSEKNAEYDVQGSLGLCVMILVSPNLICPNPAHTALQADFIWNMQAVLYPKKFSASAWWRNPGRLRLWILLILIYASDICDVRLKIMWKSTAAVNSQWEWLEVTWPKKSIGWTGENQVFTIFLDFHSARVWTISSCSTVSEHNGSSTFFQTHVKTPSVTLDTATLLGCGVDSADIQFQCPSMWCCWVAVGSMSTWSPACQCKTSVGSLDSMIVRCDTKNLLTRALVCNRIRWFDILIMFQHESHCCLNKSSILIL